MFRRCLDIFSYLLSPLHPGGSRRGPCADPYLHPPVKEEDKEEEGEEERGVAEKRGDEKEMEKDSGRRRVG
jgi:hypothetical protein